MDWRSYTQADEAAFSEGPSRPGLRVTHVFLSSWSEIAGRSCCSGRCQNTGRPGEPSLQQGIHSGPGGIATRGLPWTDSCLDLERSLSAEMVQLADPIGDQLGIKHGPSPRLAQKTAYKFGWIGEPFGSTSAEASRGHPQRSCGGGCPGMPKGTLDGRATNPKMSLPPFAWIRCLFPSAPTMSL
jgi:hypothetical protein